jgi:hypothetical protein
MLCVRRDFSPADKNAADEHFGPLGFASCPLPGFLRNLSRLHPWTRDDPPRDKLESQHQEMGIISMTTLSSRVFRQEIGRAKKAAERGPVFTTDRGQTTDVLFTGEDRKITAGGKTILDLLGMPDAAEVEFEPPRLRGELFRRTL